MPSMSEVYAALAPLMRAKEIRNLENRYTDTLTTEGIEDARGRFVEKIITNSAPFWAIPAEGRPAWIHTAYSNFLKDTVKYETRRNSGLLKKAVQKCEDQIKLLRQRSIDTNEDLSEKIAKLEEELRNLKRVQDEPDEPSGDISEPGCAMYCLEKLAKKDPRHYALFAAKVLDHTPDQIVSVVRGVLNKDYTPFTGIGKMLNDLKTVYVEITNPKTTETQIADLLAKVFGYASGGTVNVTITQIKNELRDCVNNCNKK